MRGKLAAVALLLWGAALWRSPAQPAAWGSLHYTMQLEGLREATHRLELRARGWRLLALERGAGLEAEYLAFGLGCPWGAVGPLAPRGLLRALADPLGYAPGSAVFLEPAGFRLEGALQGASRRGLWLEPLPGLLGLFLVRRPPEQSEVWGAGLFGGEPLGPLQAGGILTLFWPTPAADPARAQAPEPAAAGAGSFVELQTLAMLSRPATDGAGIPDSSSSAVGDATPESMAGSTSEWFHERPPFPGGGLLHLGGSLRLQASGGRLACLLLGAASGGQRIAPGLVGLWRMEAQGLAGCARGTWSVSALLGACTEGYRLPDGNLYPAAWAAGLDVELRPRPALRLAGGWQRRIDRPPAVPEGFFPGTEQGELSARLTVPLRAGSRLEARTEARARVRYAADGAVDGSAAGELGLRLCGRQGRLDLELKADWTGEGIGLRGQLGGERRGVRLQAGAAVRPPALGASAACWRPFGRLELDGKDFLFWLSAAGGDAGGEVSLGWSAAQALPKSPTVNTSRARR